MGETTYEAQQRIRNTPNGCICSHNERAFLDELKEKAELKMNQYGGEYLNLKNGILIQSDFTKSNLSELVEGKG